MPLAIADHWYETLTCDDGVTLIREQHVHPDLRCNIWHVRGRDADLLVDTGLGLVPLRDSIAALNEKQVLAVASHTHFDHVGAHHEFNHRLCHPLEKAVLARPDGHNTVWSDYAAKLDLEQAFQALPHPEFSLAQYQVKPAPPTRLIDEGDEIDLGDRLFKVFHMPGHSPGSVCLYEAATRTMYCGDVLYDGELLDSLYHSDPERYIETLARLRELPAERYHCGHYASFGRARMQALIDAYLHARRSGSTGPSSP